MLVRMLRACWLAFGLVGAMGLLVLTGCKNDFRYGDSRLERDVGNCSGSGCCGS